MPRATTLVAPKRIREILVIYVATLSALVRIFSAITANAMRGILHVSTTARARKHCRRFLVNVNVERIDTNGNRRDVLRDTQREQTFGLPVLERNISDELPRFTRLLPQNGRFKRSDDVIIGGT